MPGWDSHPALATLKWCCLFQVSFPMPMASQARQNTAVYHNTARLESKRAMRSCGTVVGSPSLVGPAPDTPCSTASCGASSHPLVSRDLPVTFPIS